tara:strand:+ start:466 stop:702 length:237 start_codon:yes stop_codon:yes gene_type:complete
MANSWDYQEGDLLEIDFHGREKKIGIISRAYEMQLSRYPFNPGKRWEFWAEDGHKHQLVDETSGLDNTKTIKVLARNK